MGVWGAAGFRAAFLNSSTTDIWGWIIIGGGLSYTL